MRKEDGPDSVDKTVTFLSKRDGIDKVLKVIRYTTRLLLATSLSKPDSELTLRLKAFESSIGTSRKAYRLGKWISDANKLRRVSNLRSPQGFLQLLASGGQGTYYFVEQLTWLVKAGLLDQGYAPMLSKVSSWAEIVGYLGNITLSYLYITANLQQERALRLELTRRKKHGEQHADDDIQRQRLQSLRQQRLLHVAAITQDIADSLLALSDIRGGGGTLGNPVSLCLCGLLSASISIHKNWPS